MYRGDKIMTFICCEKHLECAVITEVELMKSESNRSVQQGGREMIGGIITISPNTTIKCQVCGTNSLFSVYYQVQYAIDTVKK
jgi:hypothetical protein